LARSGIDNQVWKKYQKSLALGDVLGLSTGDAIVDRLAASEALFGSVPMGDGRLAQFPAEQDDLIVDLAGEIEEADVDVLDLNADGIDLVEGVADALDGFLALGATQSDLLDLDESAAGKKDALVKLGKFAVDFLDELLAIDGLAKQALENGQQRVGFLETEGLHSLVRFYSYEFG